MEKVKFYDENTRQWWLPDTGGANIPALNNLMAPWNMAFSDQVFEGDFRVGNHDMYYASGTSISQFPPTGLVVRADLKNQGNEVITGKVLDAPRVPVLGLHQMSSAAATEQDTISGRVALYGDSNCLDNSHLQKDCYWLLDALLEYTMFNVLSPVIEDVKSVLTNDDQTGDKLARRQGNHLYQYSKVLDSHSTSEVRVMPACPAHAWAQPHPLNISSPTNESATVVVNESQL
jgi:membrane-bound transcription factor site-1 protease